MYDFWTTLVLKWRQILTERFSSPPTQGVELAVILIIRLLSSLVCSRGSCKRRLNMGTFCNKVLAYSVTPYYFMSIFHKYCARTPKLLVYPMIGHLWWFTSTLTSIIRLRARTYLQTRRACETLLHRTFRSFDIWDLTDMRNGVLEVGVVVGGLRHLKRCRFPPVHNCSLVCNQDTLFPISIKQKQYVFFIVKRLI